MTNFSQIQHDKLRETMIKLDKYINDLMDRQVGYSFNRLISYRDKVIKYYEKYIKGRKDDVKDQAKEFEVNQKDLKKAFSQEQTNLLATFSRNVIRSFGQASYSIEKNLGTEVTNPGNFGVRALLALIRKKPKVTDLKRVEGFTRLTKNKTMHRIDLIPYLLMLIKTGQEEYDRRLNETTAYAMGTDLAYISQHPCWLGPQAKEVCNHWRDKIVSLNGLTRGFPKLEDAIAQNLFHPHCTHKAIPLTPKEEALAVQKKIKKYSTLERSI